MGDRRVKSSPESSLEVDALLESTIDKLVSPVINIASYYSNRSLERRILFFTWAANLFKPVAAIEVSRVLGYNYAHIHDFFVELNRSGILTKVSDSANYCRVGTDELPFYVRRDLLLGRKLSGRPPDLYAFKSRMEINMDYFVDCFNLNGGDVWQRAAKKAMNAVRSFDPSYASELVNDCLFILGKIQPVIRVLEDCGTIFIERKPHERSIKVKLRIGAVQYNVPSKEPFNRFV